MNALKKVLFYRSLTGLHVGNGSSLGIVDLPIYREAHTDFPMIPSSSIKGVLRARYGIDKLKLKPSDIDKIPEENDKLEGDKKKFFELFGKTDSEGKIILTDAKILLFPVKSLKGIFAWITCPMVLKRFQEDTGIRLDLSYDDIKDDKAKVPSNEVVIDNKVILEEFVLNANVDNSVKSIKTAIKHDIYDTRIVMVSDNVFRFFVKNYTEIVARIVINQAKGTAKTGGLWYQEIVPSESIYYSILMGKTEQAKDFAEFINEKNIFQFGGDETLGRGFTKIIAEDLK